MNVNVNAEKTFQRTLNWIMMCVICDIKVAIKEILADEKHFSSERYKSPENNCQSALDES